MVGSVKLLSDAAKALKNRVGSKQPATAQVTALFDQARKTRDTLTGSSVAAAVQSGWSGINGQLGILATAFSQPWE
jgi:hypothetical protein